MTIPRFENPARLTEALEEVGYLADTGLAAAAFLALRLRRPLFLEGDPGVGKTTFAQAVAAVIGAPVIRLQCYEGIDASQALYDWNFPAQVLHLRAADTQEDRAALRASLYAEEFLIARPILKAIRTSPSVLLIDEIDRADDQFEAFLLEALAENSVTIPELPEPVRAEVPPVVILTSNRTREVHDALKRRCLYHFIAHPTRDREMAILRRKVPMVSAQLAADVATLMQRLRSINLVKPPGIAEAIDLAQAVYELQETWLSPVVAEAAVGTIAKHQDDQAAVRREMVTGHRHDAVRQRTES